MARDTDFPVVTKVVFGWKLATMEGIDGKLRLKGSVGLMYIAQYSKNKTEAATLDSGW